jgi:hypothetical protein
VLRFVAVGKPNKRIAAELGASERDEQPAHGRVATLDYVVGQLACQLLLFVAGVGLSDG